MRQMMEMDGDWCEERPTLIDSYGWALNPECFYLNLPKFRSIFHIEFYYTVLIYFFRRVLSNSHNIQEDCLETL